LRGFWPENMQSSGMTHETRLQRLAGEAVDAAKRLSDGANLTTARSCPVPAASTSP